MIENLEPRLSPNPKSPPALKMEEVDDESPTWNERLKTQNDIVPFKADESEKKPSPAKKAKRRTKPANNMHKINLFSIGNTSSRQLLSQQGSTRRLATSSKRSLSNNRGSLYSLEVMSNLSGKQSIENRSIES